MAAADLVISRAGANTLAELAALGKPSLLVPLPGNKQPRRPASQCRDVPVPRRLGRPGGGRRDTGRLHFRHRRALCRPARRRGHGTAAPSALGRGVPRRRSRISSRKGWADVREHHRAGRGGALAARGAPAGPLSPLGAFSSGPPTPASSPRRWRPPGCSPAPGAARNGPATAPRAGCRRSSPIPRPCSWARATRTWRSPRAPMRSCAAASRRPSTFSSAPCGSSPAGSIPRSWTPMTRGRRAWGKGGADRGALAELAPGKELPPARELRRSPGEDHRRPRRPSRRRSGRTRSASRQVRRLAAWAHLTACGVAQGRDHRERRPDAGLRAQRAAEAPGGAARLGAPHPPDHAQGRHHPDHPFPASALPLPAASRRGGEGGPGEDLPPGGRRASTACAPSSWRGGRSTPRSSRQLARRFLELVRRPASAADIVEQMAELLPEAQNARDRLSRETATSFLEELLSHMRELLRGGVPASRPWSSGPRRCGRPTCAWMTFNMQPAAVLEALYSRMRTVLRREEAVAAGRKNDGAEEDR